MDLSASWPIQAGFMYTSGTHATMSRLSDLPRDSAESSDSKRDKAWFWGGRKFMFNEGRPGAKHTGVQRPKGQALRSP